MTADEIDLEYALAIDDGGTDPEGVYVYPSSTGALVVVDGGDASASKALSAAECVRLAHYLLACAKAAEA